MDPGSACPEEKAISLHCAAVEKYNRYSRKDRSSDAKFGTIILRFAYSVGFLLTFFITPLFIGLLFKILNKAFDENSPQNNGNGSNTSGTEAPESSNYHYKPMFVAASIISFMYSFASISIGFYNLPNKSRQPLNEFEMMKTGFLLLLLIWLVILTVAYAIYYSSMDCMKKVLASLAILSLGILAADIMLTLPPTILLLFAYPIDSSALLALHIAIFYCATMVLAVYFTKIHKWITKHHSIAKKILKMLKVCRVKKDNPNAALIVIYIGWCIHIFLGLIVLVALPITYVCIIFFYQFVVARSNTNDISLNGLSLYIPSVVIAVFGFVIKKGAFGQDTAEKEKKKEEQMLIAQATVQAKKIWTIVGHRLEENDSSELSQMKVGELARKLKTESEEETIDPDVNS